MQETFMEIGRSPLAASMLRRIGIKPPPQLIRSHRPWSDDLLSGKHILVSADPALRTLLLPFLKQQKATITTASAAPLAPLNASSEALNVAKVFQGTVFDATGFTALSDLKALFSFFHKLKGQLGFNHRIVILSKEGVSPEGKAIDHAIASFARSLSREFGPKGINVNVLQRSASQNHAACLLPILGFFLSDFCAFITGQIIPLSESDQAAATPNLAGSLAGKRALVTGAAQGIGYSICRRLAEEGAHVIGLDRPECEAALKDLCKETDGEYLLATLGKDHDQLIAKLASKAASLDILVHNAGVTRDRTLFGMKEKEWDDVLGINLEAVVDITTRVLYRGMLAKGGRIISMASVVGISGNFGQTNYAASKAGVIGYMQGLAGHLAREGATANAVAPGFIETGMTANIPFVTKQIARRMSAMVQGGLPDDVAEMVCFLASPCSHAINGQVLRVCGGSFLGA
ncbi:MAG: 3-oxoacyl-ACP reductase [Chitinophagaceae bacterium]|nr:3-oxoacyl-ACP reductase [Oligoflexus sp.]